MKMTNNGNVIIEINLNLLEQERLNAGLALSDISRLLGYKTPSGYWLVEHGARKVSVPTLYLLSKLYNKSMEYFIVEKSK